MSKLWRAIRSSVSDVASTVASLADTNQPWVPGRFVLHGEDTVPSRMVLVDTITGQGLAISLNPDFTLTAHSLADASSEEGEVTHWHANASSTRGPAQLAHRPHPFARR